MASITSKRKKPSTTTKKDIEDSDDELFLTDPPPSKKRKGGVVEKQNDSSVSARSKKIQQQLSKRAPVFYKQPSNASYDIKPFDCATIRPNSTILFVGNRRTGKSTTMRSVMWETGELFYDGFVYSATQELGHSWLDIIPEKYFRFCDEHFPADKLKEDLKNQLTRRTKVGELTPPTLFVFEDVEALVKPSLWHTPGVRTLAFNGRHYSTYTFFAIQYLMSIPKEFRGAFDYIFLMMEKMSSIREAIYEQYGGIFPTREEFEKVFLALTANRGCMVLDMRALSNKIEENVFTYKTNPTPPPFKIGCKDVTDPRIEAINKLRKEKEEQNAPPEAEPEGPKRRGRKKATGEPATKKRKTTKKLDEDDEIEEEPVMEEIPGDDIEGDEDLQPLPLKRGKRGTKPEAFVKPLATGGYRVSII